MTAQSIDLSDPAAVTDVFRAAAEAARSANCRRGSIDVIEPPGTLIAAGDIHDNPLHFEALKRAANMHDEADGPPHHLLLQEIIHSDRLIAGVDMSYRALARVAQLRVRFPEHTHAILANHELAQAQGTPIVKAGVRMVEAFQAGLDHAFGDEAESVAAAISEFVYTMPIALRCRTPQGDILCAHSLPGVGGMSRFDPTVLERDLTDEDLAPRRGSAHLMIWGRGYDADQLEDLVERWGVSMFILGHEHVDSGVRVVQPNAVVVNSDHERGVYLAIDLESPPSPTEAVARARPLADEI